MLELRAFQVIAECVEINVERVACNIELIFGVLAQFSDKSIVGLEGIGQRASNDYKNRVGRLELPQRPPLLRYDPLRLNRRRNRGCDDGDGQSR